MPGVTVHTDGGCRGNPGPAGIGVVIEGESGGLIMSRAEFIPRATNNEAEYQAVLQALRMCLSNGFDEAVFYCDSRLIVEQINGSWKIKDFRMKALNAAVRNLIGQLKSFEIIQIPREENTAADALANEAMDGALGK